MPTYRYDARNDKGVALHGVIEEESEAKAIAILQERGLLLTKISLNVSAVKSKRVTTRHKRVKQKDLLFFLNNLAVLLDAGIPIIRALEIISEQVASQRLSQIVLDIKNDINAGNTLKEAMLKHPRYFPSFWSFVIEASEASGTLSKGLMHLGKNLEINIKIKSKVVSATAYPALVLLVTLGAGVIFMFKVIPTFAKLFQSFNAKLPAFTLFVISISDFLRNYFLWIAALIAAVVVALRQYFSTPGGRRILDQTLLSTPILGAAVSDVIHARTNIILATLTRSGLNLLRCLEIAAHTSGNTLFREGLNTASVEVQKGKALNVALAENPIFSTMMIQLVMIGEESGRLPDMFEKIAVHYEGQIDTTITRLSTLIEPVSIVFAALIVGPLVVAMYLPLFNIANLVKH